MSAKRPVNLDLTTVKFPITAISSILHRLSGILLFLAVPFILWTLQKSFQSPADFNEVLACLSSGSAKFALWFVLSGLIYHIVAGLRHLLMDMGIGESKQGGTRGAQLVLIISFALIAWLGVMLW